MTAARGGIALALRLDMLLALLPALSVAAATEAVTFESRVELERALSGQVRAALEAGWELVDVSPEEEGSALGFSLARDGEVLRHVVSFDGTNVYRIGPAPLPTEPTRPSERMLAALRGGGGISITVSCGGAYAEAYRVDGFAAGPDAGGLVARSLSSAEDLESAWMVDGRAVFQLEARGQALDLIITLTEDGAVAEAELRRYDSREDRMLYRRQAAMSRALRGTFVSSVRRDADNLELHTPRGRFAIDPDGTAFRPKHLDAGYMGCGC